MSSSPHQPTLVHCSEINSRMDQPFHKMENILTLVDSVAQFDDPKSAMTSIERMSSQQSNSWLYLPKPELSMAQLIQIVLKSVINLRRHCHNFPKLLQIINALRSNASVLVNFVPIKLYLLYKFLKIFIVDKTISTKVSSILKSASMWENIVNSNCYNVTLKR